MEERLKPYEAYKETGLLWLDKVPEHWQLRKIKYLFGERIEKGYPNEPLLAATQTKGVVPKDMYETRTVVASKDLHLLKLVEVGDFVISLRSFQGGLEYAYYRGIISPAYTIMIPLPEIQKGYFRHFAKSRPFLGLLKMCVTGIREGQNIDYDVLKKEHIPLPSRTEQDQIVRYLDYKLSKIAKYIRAKKKLIGLLKEQKQAIINRAVTKGIDPNVKMKPSGIEWLGEVPQGWEVRSLSKIASIVRGASPRPAGDTRYFGGHEIPWITVSELTKDDTPYIKSSASFLTNEGRKHSRYIEKDTLLFSNSGATLGVPKILCIAGCINDGSVALLNPLADKLFLYYFLRCKTQDLRKEMAGYGQPNLNTSIVKSIKVPLPSLSEQQSIVEYIETKTAAIDTAITATQKEIDLITEYRVRLISDVVTGKVDVRGIDIPDAVCEPVAEEYVEAEEDNEPERTED